MSDKQAELVKMVRRLLHEVKMAQDVMHGKHLPKLIRDAEAILAATEHLVTTEPRAAEAAGGEG